MTVKPNLLSKVFKNPDKHNEVATIIIKHRSTSCDIRDRALENIDLSETREILDLGCGFGFFIKTLSNRVSPDAHITGIDQFPEYGQPFVGSCKRYGLKGKFLSNGVELIRKMEDDSFDLILSSYAMYFFPEILEEIPRVLRPSGTFITITHIVPHMIEFTTYIRNILKNYGVSPKIDLPYEALINRFSDKTAPAQLTTCFHDVFSTECLAKLYFGKEDAKDLIKYFNFKEPFFIPQNNDPDGKIHQKVVSKIRQDLSENKSLLITKDDIIFICKSPLKQKMNDA